MVTIHSGVHGKKEKTADSPLVHSTTPQPPVQSKFIKKIFDSSLNSSCMDPESNPSEGSSTPQSESDSSLLLKKDIHPTTSKKGWEAFASLFWEKVPKPPHPVTFADGITNLLGIESQHDDPLFYKSVSRPHHPIALSKSASAVVAPSQSTPLDKKDKTYLKKATFDQLTISPHDYQDAMKSYADEIHNLKTLLNVNKKAFSDRIRALHKRQKQLDHERNRLVKQLAIANYEREQQEALLAQQSLQLNRSTREFIVLQSELLHYKHLFRRWILVNTPSSPPNATHLPPSCHLDHSFQPFQALQLLHDNTQVSVKIDFAPSTQGHLYLIVFQQGNQKSVQYSQVQQLDLVPLDDNTSYARLTILSLGHGLLTFLVQHQRDLEQCLKLFSPTSSVVPPPQQKNHETDENVSSPNQINPLVQLVRHIFGPGRHTSPSRLTPRILSFPTHHGNADVDGPKQRSKKVSHPTSSFPMETLHPSPTSHSPNALPMPNLSCGVSPNEQMKLDFLVEPPFVSSISGKSKTHSFTTKTMNSDAPRTSLRSIQQEKQNNFSTIQPPKYKKENKLNEKSSPRNIFSTSSLQSVLSLSPTFYKFKHSTHQFQSLNKTNDHLQTKMTDCPKKPFQILEHELKKNIRSSISNSTLSLFSSSSSSQPLASSPSALQRRNYHSSDNPSSPAASWSTSFSDSLTSQWKPTVNAPRLFKNSATRRNRRPSFVVIKQRHGIRLRNTRHSRDATYRKRSAIKQQRLSLASNPSNQVASGEDLKSVKDCLKSLHDVLLSQNASF